MAAGLRPSFRYFKNLYERKIAPIPGNVEGIPVPFGVTAEHVIKQRDSLPPDQVMFLLPQSKMWFNMDATDCKTNS